jgi:hypothetical protein
MLKHNELLLIQTQEEFNQLAELLDGVALDSLHIDEDYVAYMDEVVMVVPLSDIDDTHFMRNTKPTPFKKWYKKQKRS